MDTFLSSMQNLTELRMWNVFGITDNTILVISEYLSGLVLLSLKRSSDLTDISVLAISRGLKQLRHLHMFLMTKITDQGIAFLTGCDPDVTTLPPPKLNYLDLEYCPFLTDKAMMFLSIGQPGLKHRNVGYSKITNIGVKHLTGIKQLTDLYLISCQQIDAAALKLLANMPQLRKLHLGLSSIDDVGLAELAIDPGVSCVTYLILRLCDRVSDDGMSSLAKLVSLRQLNLSHSIVTDVGLANLAQGASKTTTLSISGTDVSDEGLRHLSKMTNLTTLEAAECGNISVEGLAALGKGRAPITSVNVSGCWNLQRGNDKSVFQSMPSLMYLNDKPRRDQ